MKGFSFSANIPSVSTPSVTSETRTKDQRSEAELEEEIEALMQKKRDLTARVQRFRTHEKLEELKARRKVPRGGLSRGPSYCLRRF